MDLSIVVATKNRATLLHQMLSSIAGAARGLTYEVIVIEGSSTDNTLEVIKNFGAAQVISENIEMGPGRHSWPEMYNVGFKKARGDWTIYASDDITFEENCFTNAIESLKAAPPRIAGGIFFYRNEVAEAGWEKYGIDFLARDLPLLNYGLIRRQVLESLGYINTDYQFYCADGDLTYQLASRDLILSPLPRSFMIHHNLLDTQKQANLKGLEHDCGLFKERWSHLGETATPVYPRRMCHERSLEAVFALPLMKDVPGLELNKLWRAIALMQYNEIQQSASLLHSLVNTKIPAEVLDIVLHHLKGKIAVR